MALVVRGLSKSYGIKRVLDSVDLVVESGQIHALLGPNGSGKSTLIGCLSGAVVPEAGTIEIDGVPHNRFTPREAMAAGVAVIYQHFSLVPSLSVADNLFLGDEQRTGLRIDKPAQVAGAQRLLAPFGRPIRADALVSDLPVGDRQLVEIAKALRRRPRILVLDEPTAALGDDEARYLGRYLKTLRDEGLAILYVTHIIGEVFEIGDFATVLRDGHVVLRSAVKDIDPPRVITAISPSTSTGSSDQRSRRTTGQVALELEGVTVDAVGPIDLGVRSGEILAVFGLMGSGRTELLEGIAGVRRVTSGTMRVAGNRYTPGSPRDALRARIALVAGDRRRQSIFDKLSALDNLLLPHFGRLSRWLTRRKQAEVTSFSTIATRLRLEPPHPRALAWAFSGGNQQKLAVGRWLAGAEMDLLLLDEPTQGIDVGARADLYALVRELARVEGKAIIFSSSDPEETMALADRVVILRRGRLVAELDRDESTERRILGIAHGAEESEQRAAPRSLAEAVR
jgi:ribose transport system ATP-binding protein